MNGKLSNKRRICFQILILLLLVEIGGSIYGCSPSNKKKEKVLSSKDEVLALWVKYPDISSLSRTQYLQFLLRRVSPQTHLPAIRILDASIPFAVIGRQDVILVSRSLLLQLPDEGSLAFILAHELAHRDLRHTEESPDTVRQREFDADRLAMQMLIRGGFSKDSAFHALFCFHPSVLSSSQYPTREERAISLRHDSRQAIPLSFPMIDSRAFHKFQRDLR